jgi:UDP-N-acetylmuramoyl-tripeptide--D-alanyl-D-alanine ligase
MADFILLDRREAEDSAGVRLAQRELAEFGLLGYQTVHAIGEMLNEQDFDEMDALGRNAVRLNISKILSLGESMQIVHLAAEQEGSWNGESLKVISDSEAYDEIMSLRDEPVALLITGSNSRLADDLVARIGEAP